MIILKNNITQIFLLVISLLNSFFSTRISKLAHCFLSAALLVIFFITASAQADTIRIANLLAEPYGFISKDNRASGILNEITIKIAEEANLTPYNSIHPFKRVVYMLDKGEADLSIALPHKNLNNVTVPVMEMFPTEVVIFGRKGAVFKSLNDLHGKTVGLLRGAQYDAEFMDDDKIIKVRADDYEHSLLRLFNKRIDAVIGPKTGIYYEVRKMGLNPEVLSEPLILNKNSAWLFLSKQFATDVNFKIIKDAAQKVITKGDIDKIISKYENLAEGFMQSSL